MDGWNTTSSFLLGFGLFSGANWLLVSGRVLVHQGRIATEFPLAGGDSVDISSDGRQILTGGRVERLTPGRWIMARNMGVEPKIGVLNFPKSSICS